MEHPTPLETQDTIRRSRRFLLPASVFLVVLIAAVASSLWFYLSGPCEVDAVEEASALLVSQMRRYDAVYQVATNASGTSLRIPITVLQQIRMDTKDVVVPACMQTAKNELLSTMDAVIRAFLASMAQEPDETIRNLIRQSRTHFVNFTTELEAVKECAPHCLPRLLD